MTELHRLEPRNHRKKVKCECNFGCATAHLVKHYIMSASAVNDSYDILYIESACAGLCMQTFSNSPDVLEIQIPPLVQLVRWGPGLD